MPTSPLSPSPPLHLLPLLLLILLDPLALPLPQLPSSPTTSTRTSILASALPVPTPSLPGPLLEQYTRLSADAQRVASVQVQQMGALDSARTRLGKRGRFFIVEDAVSDNGVRQRRMVSSSSPSGYSAEGVPIHHSLNGSTNVLYLNFLGGPIRGRAWNDDFNLPPVTTRPYDLDGAPNVLSAQEQQAISSIWSRVAEDYIPFGVDVTTEAPAVFTSTVGTACITSSLSVEGVPMPASSAGGMAFLDVFGDPAYASYFSPALVYYNNLGGGREDFVAEAISHELGHHLGLSHDGVIGSSPYYYGAGQGAVSWAPIMGAAYFQSVTKFSRGDYPRANNKEDDVAIITAKLGRRPDMIGNTRDTAFALSAVGIGGSGDALQASVSGIIEDPSDVDIYMFSSASGTITASAAPFLSLEDTSGNNLDIRLDLYDENGQFLGSADPSDSCQARVVLNVVAQGLYYVNVSAVGNSVTPYSAYGSMGQYTLTVSFSAPASDASRQPTSPSTTGTQAATSSSTSRATSTVRTKKPKTTTTTTTTTRTTSTTSTSTTSRTTATSTTTTIASATSSSSPSASPTILLSAPMTSFPTGWTVSELGTWAYGMPTSASDPRGRTVVGTTLVGSGLYPEPLSRSQQIISLPFSTLGFSSVTLSFSRFLGVQADDVVSIHSCVAGRPCVSEWTNEGKAIVDTVWTRISFPLSPTAANASSVMVRFGVGPTRPAPSGPSASFGWNIRSVTVSAWAMS